MSSFSLLNQVYKLFSWSPLTSNKIPVASWMKMFINIDREEGGSEIEIFFLFLFRLFVSFSSMLLEMGSHVLDRSFLDCKLHWKAIESFQSIPKISKTKLTFFLKFDQKQNTHQINILSAALTKIEVATWKKRRKKKQDDHVMTPIAVIKALQGVIG